MIMFNYDSFNNSVQPRPMEERGNQPSVPPRKRVIEEPEATTTLQPTEKKRRVELPNRIPLGGKSWWRFGEIQKDLIKGLVNDETYVDSHSTANVSIPPISNNPMGDVTKSSSITDTRTSNLSGRFSHSALAQNRVCSGFQSLPMKSRLNMSSTFSSTGPNPALFHDPQNLVGMNNASGGDNDSLQDDDDASFDDNMSLKFRAYQAENWTEKFEDLIEFRNQYGHCLVPNAFPHNPALAQWVKRQRYQFKLKNEGKRSTMSDERIRALDEVGFVWDSHSAVWEERLNELLEYKRANGHCNVPSRYAENRQLAVWVKRQRRQYKFYCDDKPSSITNARIAALEAIGFEWDLRAKK